MQFHILVTKFVIRAARYNFVPGLLTNMHEVFSKNPRPCIQPPDYKLTSGIDMYSQEKIQIQTRIFSKNLFRTKLTFVFTLMS